MGAGDRVALYLQNCPQFVVALYAVFRANAVAVPVNPMNRADEFGHYISDPQTKVVICAADLAGFVAEADAALPPEQRLKAVLVTRYTDAMPEGALDPAEAPNAGHRTMAACRPAVARRLRALGRCTGRRPRARAAQRRARRPGAAALHLGHHRVCPRVACTRTAR